jgi:hypothetical protein
VALKTKIGGRESDSFITVAEADAFLGVDYPDAVDSWDALSDTEKEQMLRTAAQLMGYLSWKGRRIYCGQALPFPRVCESSRFLIPTEVKRAQALIAYSVVFRSFQSRYAPSGGDESASRVTQVSLGGLLSVSFAGSPATSGNVLDRIVRSVQYPIFAELRKFLTQIRGGSVSKTPQCSTTTTTTSTTVSTTSSSTSTTTTTTTT